METPEILEQPKPFDFVGAIIDAEMGEATEETMSSLRAYFDANPDVINGLQGSWQRWYYNS